MSTRDLPSRGTLQNPANRYERLHVEVDPDAPPVEWDEDGGVAEPATPTTFFRDATRSILARNDSPDVGFTWSVNPYRGCEHGCIYCYARPSHEMLGWNAGLDFERRILVKRDAPELLRKQLAAPRWKPDVIALSGNTDCYQPVEQRLGITRRCLEVLLDFRNPVSVITKSALIARDADLLGALAGFGAAHALVSITTLDAGLARRMEPRAAVPERRLEAIAKLADAGVPVGVMVAPVVPGLNDEEIARILGAAAAAGARSASWVLLRLAPPLDALFTAWLDERLPERKQRILSRIRETRDGLLSDAEFGRRMRGQGPYAAQIAALFQASARKYGLDRGLPPLDAGRFRRPLATGDQLALL